MYCEGRSFTTLIFSFLLYASLILAFLTFFIHDSPLSFFTSFFLFLFSSFLFHHFVFSMFLSSKFSVSHFSLSSVSLSPPFSLVGYGIVRPKLLSLEWLAVAIVSFFYFVAGTVRACHSEHMLSLIVIPWNVRNYHTYSH
jgi:hypothetical protein